MSVAIFENKKSGLRDRLKLKKYLIYIGKKENTLFSSLNIIFCSDDELLSINKDFLQHDYYTDIITFDLTETGEIKKTAELYISIDRVRNNAISYNSSIKKELHRVIFHGVLHLCGFKDKKEKDIKLMRQKEDEYLRHYFKE